ncbi:MAG TPA: ABC transporter ATP-binding protein, partial [Myxococcales bacterium]|nr:ABC transporter ATP-binding protein [Myxococcales bacterium]
MPEPLLELKEVVKDYGTPPLVTRALRGVDLSVTPGEFAALIGPSGSGKTTLLNVIGLLHKPTSGRMTLAGTDTTRLDDDGLTRFRARTLGFVFQFHHLVPALTALENIVVPMWSLQGRRDESMRRRALELLDAVGLAHKADSRATALSGG